MCVFVTFRSPATVWKQHHLQHFRHINVRSHNNRRSEDKKQKTNSTNVLLGLSILTTGTVFSFQSSMTSTDKQQTIKMLSFTSLQLTDRTTWWFDFIIIILPQLQLLGSRGRELTSLAVIPRLTRGRAKIQKTVTPRLTRSTDSETDGHAGVITVALRCGESVVNWLLATAYQLATLCVCPV